ncbi:helix-turn-helix domain-containing protein [Streptomyces sp. NPDC095613]|uniref:AraC-like ligand-binding domain-containing protein n=1 Tax=Streptomyces sp. NPDC095613 TaxID=3155540 RepID=UPI0033332FC1
MIKTLFRSDDLPPGARLAGFAKFQTSTRHPTRVSNARPEEFHATVRAVHLDGMEVIRLACSPFDAHRSAALIRKADPQLYSVVYTLRGELRVAQAGREAAVTTHEFALYDSSSPFRMRITTGKREITTVMHVHVPRTALSLPPDRVARLLTLPLPGREGVGGLLIQFFTSLTVDPAGYRPTDAPRLGTVGLSLLTATLAHHLDTDDLVPGESDRRTLVLRVKAFIRQHLHEPRLSPSDIAAAHHISVSYLHRLFQAHDLTVSAWIRCQRLERARRDLADPALRTVPVHRIAGGCGFSDHATFTRAFRAAYGVPPRDFRRQALATST